MGFQPPKSQNQEPTNKVFGISAKEHEKNIYSSPNAHTTRRSDATDSYYRRCNSESSIKNDTPFIFCEFDQPPWSPTT